LPNARIGGQSRRSASGMEDWISSINTHRS
jgi:hypothetical protein